MYENDLCIVRILVVLLLLFTGGMPNKSVDRVDLERFSGAWYSLSSIPTIFDKGSREITMHYTLNQSGYYIVTTCKKKDSSIRGIT
jgi:apolipoprotein D and lipocalin family protein